MHSQFRDLLRIDLTTFHEDVRQSPLYLFNSDTPVDDYVDLFNDEINRILEKHAPLHWGTFCELLHLCFVVFTARC